MSCPKCESDSIKRRKKKVNVNQSFYCKDCHHAIVISRFIEMFRCRKCKHEWKNTNLL